MRLVELMDENRIRYFCSSPSHRLPPGTQRDVSLAEVSRFSLRASDRSVLDRRGMAGHMIDGPRLNGIAELSVAQRVYASHGGRS